jgi:Cu+-exporting ATPase
MDSAADTAEKGTSAASEEKVFCCQGCKMVYELLRDNGLCTYYTLEERSGISLKNAAQPLHNKRRQRFDYLEDASVVQQLVEFSNDEISKITFTLPQIHCASCLWLLEKLHKLHAGVVSSRVDFVRKHLSVTFHQQTLSLRALVELLTTLGYEPALHLNNLNASAEREFKAASAKKQATLYLKMGVAGFAFANTMIFSFPEYLSATGDVEPALRMFFGVLSIVLAIPVLVFSAQDYFVSSWQSLRQRHINLDVPVALGIIALFVRSVIEILNGSTSGYLDSFSGLVLLLLVGKLFQQKTFDTIAFDRDYQSYFPIAVTVKRPAKKTSRNVPAEHIHRSVEQAERAEDSTEDSEHSEETTIPLSALNVGEHLVLRNRELVPADSRLLSSVGHIDYSFVTGESAPVEVLQGEKIYAGGRVLGGAVEMITVKPVSQSYLTSLWNNEAFHKHEPSLLETVSDRFGAYFTVFVLVLAALVFVAWLPNLHTALNAATAVLVIACPCAMTLASPFALGWTMKIFGNAGLYLKNPSVVLELTTISAIVFDKTGTLTHTNRGKTTFHAAQNQAQNHAATMLSANEQAVIALALKQSVHPLSRSIAHALNSVSEVQTALQGFTLKHYEEQAGKGVHALVQSADGKEWVLFVGSAEWIGTVSLRHHSLIVGSVRNGNVQIEHGSNGSISHVVLNGVYRGYFVVNNQYRSGLQELFARLRARYKLSLLSGDNDAERAALTELFGATPMKTTPSTATSLVAQEPLQMAFFQTPQDKMNAVKALQEQGERVMMVGDGLNDAGALKQSNVGVAIAEHSGAFSPACDATLAAESLHRLADFVAFARTARRVIIGAFWISVVYNIVGLSYAALGLLSPLFSAILMPISNATVIGFTTAAIHIAAYHKRFQTVKR